MKVLERSPFRAEDGSISTQNRLRGTMQFGWDWYPGMQAQAVVTQRLGKALGNEHILLRNYLAPRTDITVPLILLGPQGVRMIVASPARGIFRAKGDQWQAYNSSRRAFKHARPNLLAVAVGLSQLVLRQFQDEGYPLPEVEGVVIFTDPRAHVDSQKPVARVVQTDAIDHFAANLLQLPPILNGNDVNALLEALIHPKRAAPEAGPELEPQPEAAPKRTASPPQPEPLFEPVFPDTPLKARALPASAGRRPGLGGLTRGQWLLLGAMFLVEILILAAMAYLVLGGDLAF